MILELPFPPSVNHYWGSRVVGSGSKKFVSRYINAKGKIYRQAVIDTCLAENLRMNLTGPLACTIDLYPPCNRRRDCDNYPKAIQDSLAHAGVFEDDSQIIDLRVRMHPKKPPGCVIVTIEKISDDQCGHNQIDLMAG